jgi:aryl-alcohol dehydrogenase-like predicted oxidoreductase
MTTGASHIAANRQHRLSDQVLANTRDIGVDFLDTSDAYGHGRNEELIACAVKAHRDDYVIASKFGNLRAPDGSPTSDGRPE